MNRSSVSEILLDEVESVEGERCEHSCTHHDFDSMNEIITPRCQRAKNHAGATLVIDMHMFIRVEDGKPYPVMFTEHCCADGDS